MSDLFRFLMWVAVIAGAICGIVYYAYADVWVVPVDDPRLLVSIEPTLRGGDILLAARHGLPGVGDLARCTDPDEPRRWVIGRVIGLGGGDVELHGQSFSTPGSHPTGASACGIRRLVNPATGDEVELGCRNEEFAGHEYQSLSHARDGGGSESTRNLKVPLGKTFLLSDDRYLHLDSRDYGSLAETSCQHLVFRLWGAAGFSDGSRRFTFLW